MRNRSLVIFTSLLLIGDVLAILGAYSLAYIFRVKISGDPIAHFVSANNYFWSLLMLIPFIILFLALSGTYKTSKKSFVGQIMRILVGAIAAMLFLVTLDYFYSEHIFPAKLVPIYGLLLSFVFLIFVRLVLFAGRWLWWKKDKHRQSVVIVGSDDYIARDIAEDIAKKHSGYKLVGIVGDQRFKFTTHKSFKDVIKQHSPDIIIQIATLKNPTIDTDLLRYSIENYAEFKFVPTDANNLPTTAKLELLMGDFPVLNIQQTTLSGWGRFAKRIFDFIMSGLAIIVLSPVLLIISIANRYVFGKVFFSQNRLTRGYKQFRLYKFQTVRKDLNGLTPEQAFRKIGKPELIKPYRDNGDFLENDPRYGKWARFLRKTSLDELPQFFNVLIGDISLVGPRALIPQELNSYDKKHLVLSVKSGITGLAQISGRRDLPWEQRRKLDIYYAQNWTFAMDIQILISTAWQVLSRRGAE